MENQIGNAQWYIITAIGGKEDSIADAIKEKIHNFGYDEFVGAVRVFKHKQITEEIYNKDSPEIPANPKKTKTLEWQILPDGKYKRIRTKVSNRFPGYVFINMIYDRDVWFAIRNTPGVLGFVGSSGKGAIPIPITIEEYAKIDKENEQASASSIVAEVAPTTTAETLETPIVMAEEVKKVHITEAKIGQNVEILEGVFTGMVGEVKKLDNAKGSAIVALDIFGRSQEVEINYDQFKLAL